MTRPHSAWVVEDDPKTSQLLGALLEERGYQVARACAAAEARAWRAERGFPDAVTLDLGLPDADGMALLEAWTGEPDPPLVVVMTGEERVDRAVRAMQLGAVDYLLKPVQPLLLALTLDRLERELASRGEQRQLRASLAGHGSFLGLVGASPPMRRLYELIERVGPSRMPVLVRGESGTGKELCARAIHRVSPRCGSPFVAVNCATVPPTLLDSTFFGHERGAFTGASERRAGLFQQADTGTLFLDEITEMPLEHQANLLRALEEGTIRPLGATRDLPVNVRVVAATNRDPLEAVAQGKLRQDLYYRLDVFPLTLPPLRERSGDLPRLAHHLLEQLASEEGAAAPELTARALGTLEAQPWPGNVRELRNVLSRAWLLAKGRAIDAGDLLGLEGKGASDAASPDAPRGAREGVTVPPTATLRDAERLVIQAALERHGWHRERAARALEVSLRSLYNKIRDYGLVAPEGATPRKAG